MKRLLLASAACGLFGSSAAVAAPVVGGALAASEFALEGGLGGTPEGAFDGYVVRVHHKSKHKRKLYYEGGEGGEGGPIVIERPVIVHYVPLIAIIIGGPVAIVLEPDLPFFAEFEPDVLVAPIGTVMPWSNPSTGHYGEIEVLDDGYDESANLPCRTYRTTVVIDGRPETAVGTACREADGTWRLVN